MVIIDKSLKTSKQCMKAARAGNAVLGCMINRTFICKNKDLMLQLYHWLGLSYNTAYTAYKHGDST